MCELIVGDRRIGPGHPCFVIAEVGINHNGDAKIARQLIDAAADAGADAVKFQVGDPEAYVNKKQWSRPRETPWGMMPYLAYRQRLELRDEVLWALKAYAESRGLVWFASPLDVGAVARLQALEVPLYKVASPMLTDRSLLEAIRKTEKPVILSTGMSTLDQVREAYFTLGRQRVAMLHCVSMYPCPPEAINLRAMLALRAFPCPYGYSGHEVGLATTVAAVALGASIVERHITLSRAMWGSDHAASVEPEGFRRLVRDIRTVELAMGDGLKRVQEGERVNMAKFRRSA